MTASLRLLTILIMMGTPSPFAHTHLNMCVCHSAFYSFNLFNNNIL